MSYTQEERDRDEKVERDGNISRIADALERIACSLETARKLAGIEDAWNRLGGKIERAGQREREALQATLHATMRIVLGKPQGGVE